MVKLVPAVRALTYGCCAAVLQVTPSLLPSELSKVTAISLLAVTALVFTTTLDDDAAIDTLPAAADPHTAGYAAELQFVAVAYLELVNPPFRALTRLVVGSGGENVEPLSITTAGLGPGPPQIPAPALNKPPLKINDAIALLVPVGRVETR
jgi:hypothetical protein